MVDVFFWDPPFGICGEKSLDPVLTTTKLQTSLQKMFEILSPTGIIFVCAPTRLRTKSISWEQTAKNLKLKNHNCYSWFKPNMPGFNQKAKLWRTPIKTETIHLFSKRTTNLLFNFEYNNALHAVMHLY